MFRIKNTYTLYITAYKGTILEYKMYKSINVDSMDSFREKTNFGRRMMDRDLQNR
jgi:hypothetical protein